MRGEEKREAKVDKRREEGGEGRREEKRLW
jgi:hypothetical protein